MNYLDGANRTDYGEDGRSYGIEPEVYQMLAECAIALWHAAGVEPVTLEGFSDRPGAVCILYSRTTEYRIVIEMEKLPPSLTLQSALLDSPDEPRELYQGQADLITDWAYCQHLVRFAEDPDYYTRHAPPGKIEIKRAWTRKATDLW